ncbi:sugar ABC transporter substrate-binding protein [Actinomadura syzygii]|uniref:Sugar ABC transporter substrate-binding protein n=2 Tax=Actinomadura syzygii TaxID=1427538 RepID=A0A5D0UIE0_9ACTN|nr:sugar ABC transporter substrate-binding protein [Actinomadura syzygii]
MPGGGVMGRGTRLAGGGLVAVLLALAGCGGGGAGRAEGTITVWDYYGGSTPIKPVIAEFERANPKIKVKYEAYDYDTMREKYATAVGARTAPDLATLDMTWISTYAATGTLADLSKLSGGKINGEPVEGQYARGALAAMKYKGRYVTALYDFDAYALYYRRDIFKKNGIAVPGNWEQFKAAVAKLAATAPSPGKQRFQVLPDTFHFAQFLFQGGGEILNGSGKSAFAGPAGIGALTFYRDLLKSGGVYWGEDQGDTSGMPGIKDGRIAMFLNGPYMMGVLKDGAPEQKGKWAVVPAPVGVQQGSYLGGTGLSIPVTSKHKAAAWKFAQFLLRPEQQLLVAKQAGAAPATTAALNRPELTAPDPYFGGDAPFKVFLAAMTTARPFPYVKNWTDVDKAISDGVTAALLGKKAPDRALGDAAREVDGLREG